MLVIVNMQFLSLELVAVVVLFLNCGWCQVKVSFSLAQNEISDESAKEIEKGTTIKSSTIAFPKTTTYNSVEKYSERPKLVCPSENVSRFFSIPCKVTKECSRLRDGTMLCCHNRCTKGIPVPSPEPTHSPMLFGLVERVCPSEHLPEILEVKRCTTDSECSPRICCPEKMSTGEIIGFCRTAEPKLDRIPGMRQLAEPLKLVMSYMQCTPPPPPYLDLFPKPCKNPLDCFPNLCCQEQGKKYCRPPKRSLLTLVTTIAQRIVPSDVARDIITRITT